MKQNSSTKKQRIDPIRFAIVGCGRIAERHAEHIAKLGILVAVCDTKPQRAQLFSEKYGVPSYESYEKLLLAHPDADVAVVATPNGLHAEHVIGSLRAGYHVLVEKPMALTVRDCERMILESEKSGKKLFVVKQNRFNPPVVFIKKLIDTGRLGKILGVQINCFWNRNEEYYKQSDWKGTKNLDGGALYTQFSHFIDLIHWMFGNISSVNAVVGNLAHPYIEIDDHGAAIFRLENGAIGTLKYTINSFEKNMEGSVTIFSEKGTAKIGGQYLNTLEYFCVDGVPHPDLPTGGTANDYGTYKGSMSNHDRVYENLVSVLGGNGIISTSGIEGMKTVEIINKIYESGKN